MDCSPSTQLLKDIGARLPSQQVQDVAKVMTAVGCPPSGHGLLVALQQAVTCLQALASAREVSGLARFLASLSAAAASLAAWGSLPSHLRAIPDLGSLPKPYRIWFADAGRHHGKHITENIHIAFSLLLVSHAAHATPISDAIASACITLVNSGTSTRAAAKAWLDTISAIRPESSALSALIEMTDHQPTRAFLTRLLSCLGCPAPAKAKICTPDAATPATESTASADAATPAKPPKPSRHRAIADESPMHSGSLVRWQSARALKARIAQVAGLCDWDVVRPDELRQVTTRLAQHLHSGPADNAPFALLAVCSLLTGLPPRLALLLPLAPNDDLWLDVPSGCAAWNRAQIVERDPVGETILQGGHRPSQVFRIPMPTPVANCLRQRISHFPDSLTLGALLFGSSRDDVSLLRQYGIFLRQSDASDDAHQPYSARFAYSFGAALFAVTVNQIVAGLISQDFRLLAPVEADYICIDENLIVDALQRCAPQISDLHWLAGLTGPRSVVHDRNRGRLPSNPPSIAG